MVWNVAGELVSPKNITVGSNGPLFVLKAAFHQSSSVTVDVIPSPTPGGTLVSVLSEG